MRQHLYISVARFIISAWLLFILLSGCSHFMPNSFAGAALEGAKVEKKSDREQIEALGPEDPRRQKIMTLTWQIQYQREKLKGLELKYLGACYRDREYRDAMTAIENLNRQIRQLLLL